jgi:hypothetical protein
MTPGHDDVFDAAELEPDRRSQSDRTCSEDDRGFIGPGVGAVHEVAGDRHWFVESGHAKRERVWDAVQAHAQYCAFDEEVFR